MNANLYVIEDYENETALRPKKTKPKQSQSVFLPPSNEEMFISKTAKKSLRPLPDAIIMLPRKFDKPGERKTECSARPKLRTDPKNLLGIMPAKEG